MPAPLILRIPTLNDDRHDFDQMFALWGQCLGYFQEVRFDFSDCRFLRPNAVAFLGGLARVIESRQGTASFDWGSLSRDSVRANLQQNGFYHQFSGQTGPWTGNSIPYREDGFQDGNAYADYLSDMWLGRGWVHVSDALKDAIAERVLELYINAFEHSGSGIGVFSCGQHFPKQHQLTLAVVDFGLGIPAAVRDYWQREKPGHALGLLRASDCLRWAFRRGSTTKPNGTGRGMGLDLLKAFVQRNNGKLEIYSNEGYARIDAQGEHYENLSFAFEGTIAYITLNCDESFYCLASERG